MKRKNRSADRASNKAYQLVAGRDTRDRDEPSAETFKEAEQDASDPTHEKEIPSK